MRLKPAAFAFAVLAIPVAVAGSALAQTGATPPAGQEDQGERYVLRPHEDGFIRLDTRSGAMSFCTVDGGRMVCRLGADEREAYEKAIAGLEERLEGTEERIEVLETRLLESESSRLKRQDRLDTPKPSEDLEPRAPGEVPQDSVEEEFDKAMEFAERAMRRLFEAVKDLKSDLQQEEKGR